MCWCSWSERKTHFLLQSQTFQGLSFSSRSLILVGAPKLSPFWDSYWSDSQEADAVNASLLLPVSNRHLADSDPGGQDIHPSVKSRLEVSEAELGLEQSELSRSCYCVALGLWFLDVALTLESRLAPGPVTRRAPCSVISPAWWWGRANKL